MSVWDSVERSQPAEVLVHEIEDQKDQWEEKHRSQGRHDSGVDGVETSRRVQWEGSGKMRENEGRVWLRNQEGY